MKARSSLLTAASHRRDLEGLFERSADHASPIDLARDAAILKTAIEREASLGVEIAELEARLAKI
jgi:hypothetical protein